MLHQLFDELPFRHVPTPAERQASATFFEDCGAFGWLRNDRDRAVMLEIRHATGDITALSYALLESAKFNPSTGITLNFSGTAVTITGSNLNTEIRSGIRLFEGLVRHRVSWIQLEDEQIIPGPNETSVVVDSVNIG